jgi:hypothetical protein
MAEKEPKADAGTRKRTAKVALAPSLAQNVIYADGVHSLAIKAGVGQLDLYQVLTADEASESRLVTHRIVLPMAAVNELMRMFGTVAKASLKRQAAKSKEH